MCVFFFVVYFWLCWVSIAVQAFGGYFPAAVHRLLIAMALLGQSAGSRAGGLRWLHHVGSEVVIPGL